MCVRSVKKALKTRQKEVKTARRGGRETMHDILGLAYLRGPYPRAAKDTWVLLAQLSVPHGVFFPYEGEHLYPISRVLSLDDTFTMFPQGINCTEYSAYRHDQILTHPLLWTAAPARREGGGNGEQSYNSGRF